MIATGIALTCGILLALFEPRPVDVLWISFLPVGVYLAYANKAWRPLWVGICGFLWATLHAHWQIEQRLPDELNNKRLTVVGEVVNIPRRTNEFSRFELQIEQTEGSLPFAGRVRLSWRMAPDQLAAGQRWRLRVKLKRPHGFQNPGGFDYERWLFQRGIDATGYVAGSKSNVMLQDTAPGLSRLRNTIRDRIALLCADCDHEGLVQALTIGYRGQMADGERELLQQTGTAHLIAISGLHIGIIAGWFFLLGRWAWRLGLYRTGLNRRELALSLGWLAALVYSLLSGFELPAQRAMLMLSVIVAALWLRLRVNLLSSVFMALTVILLVSPLSVLSASLWLTFSALLVICLAILRLPTDSGWLLRLLQYQLLFSLLMAPLGVVIFHQLHAASLAANLVAVPLISVVIVPLNFLLQLFSWLPAEPLIWLYRAQDWLLAGLLGYLQWLLDHGLQAVSMGQVSAWRLAAITLFVLLLVIPRGMPVPRSWLLLLPLVFLSPVPARQPPGVTMTVLDVGMGTSVVVRTAHHSLVYDFGAGRAEGFSLGSWVVLPYLQHAGIDYLDRVVISHADQDHLGGVLAISDQLHHAPPVYTGTAFEVRQKWPDSGPLYDCHQAPPWRWDGVDFHFLSAGSLAGESENDRSCVLRIDSPAGSILIAGDIESSQENRLLAEHPQALDADILVAPHHGSLTSSSPAFIDAVSPRQAIFTVGYLNRWGFPRPRVLARYQARDIEILRTDLAGAVRVECENSHCETHTYRGERPRLWY